MFDEILDPNSPKKKAYEASIAEKNNLRNEVVNLRTQLAQKDATISSLSSQIVQKEVTINSLSSQAKEASNYKSYYNSAQGQVQDLQTQVKSLNNSISQKNSEFNALKTQISSSNASITSYQAQINNLQSQLDKKTKELILKNNLEKDNIETLQKVQIEVGVFKKQSTEKQLEINKINNLSIQNELINKQSNHSLIIANQKKEKLITDVLLEKQKFQETFELMLKQQKEFKENITHLQDTIKNHEKEGLKAQTSINQHKLTEEGLKEEITEYKQKLSESKKALLKLDNIILEKESKLNLFEQKIETESKNNLEIEKKLTDAEAKIDFMNKFFEDIKQEKLELKAEKLEFKQEKLELKQEIKLYKKSFLKKHDLSVSQSIEIEKLRKEMLEMSSMSISRIRNFEEEKEDFGDDSDILHTTFSHPIRSRFNSDASKKLPEIKQTGESDILSPAKTFKEIFFPLEQNNTVESELLQTTGIKLLGEDFSIVENEEL